ncbi:MAG: respiratory nitrate reductase subunit gamma [Actinobacteria bacterium]|nr:respiratory nitrate reductase subunit gamma [Actinomycetota bacterium]
MSGLTLFYTAFTYIAIAIFLYGFLTRIWKYATTPSPLKIPLTPAPVQPAGAVYRIIQEVGFFKSLFYSNRIIWLAGYLFHLALAIVLIKHARFFFASTPVAFHWITTFEIWIGFIMLLPLLLLFLLRLVIDRTYYISIMMDYLILVLLMGIAVTGILTKYFVRTDIVSVKQFVMGLVQVRPEALPADPIFIIHFTLVMLLLIYFPFSKLMHAGGIFFSPTRNQVDDPRELRHETAWAAKG